MPRFKNIRSQEMIKTLIKAMYTAFISIVFISLLLAGWTSYAFISQSSKSSEIITVIQDMFASQKSVVLDVIDLSKILLKKETSDFIINEKNDVLTETELLTDLEDDSQLNDLLIVEDNGENTLGIVIEPSLLVESENKLTEINEEPLVNEQNESAMLDIEYEMEMN